jgi:hypothetical protein
MKSSDPKCRFSPPWRVEQAGADCYEIRDANGFRLATVHCRDDLQKWSFGHSHLTSDEARRIANAIARLPELLMQRRGFHARGGGHDRWKPPPLSRREADSWHDPFRGALVFSRRSPELHPRRGRRGVFHNRKPLVLWRCGRPR